MSTRCLIGILNGDGTGEYIRVNTDGYPEWVGRLLAKNHATRDKAAELIALGDLSHLSNTLDPKPTFEGSEDLYVMGTVAHHRDWGWKWSDVGPRHLTHGLVEFDEILKESDCLYGYVWLPGGWMAWLNKSMWLKVWTPLTAVQLRKDFPNPFDCSTDRLSSPYADMCKRPAVLTPMMYSQRRQSDAF